MSNLHKVDPAAIAKQVLLEHGIEGEHSIGHTRESFAEAAMRFPEVQLTIVFNDPKVQFIYELKGGDSYFSPRIFRSWARATLIDLDFKTTVYGLKYAVDNLDKAEKSISRILGYNAYEAERNKQ